MTSFFYFDNCYYEKIGKNEPVKLEDLPFDIPDNWSWIRLKNTSELLGGYAFKSEKFSPNGIRVIRISDFDERGIKNKDIKRYPYSKELEQYKIYQNDILMCMTGGTVGKSTLIKDIFEDSYINQRVALIRIKHIDVKYFYCLLLSSYISNIVHENKTSTNDNISMKLIEDFLLPLPPIEEQQRIVDKINSFEPLLQEYDNYEKKLTELESTFADKLKKSILQYAIEGKLVKQDPNDEPASVLLERIKAEKEKLIKEGKIKRDKNESYIYQGDDKNYYENLPLGWEICPLHCIVAAIKAGGDKPTDFVDIKAEDNLYPVVANGTQNNGIIGWSHFYTVDYKSITISGRGTIGFPIIRNYKYTPVVRLLVIHLLENGPIDVILQYFLSLKCTTGVGTSIQQLTVPMIYDLPLEIPPMDEQKRIANKINSIFKTIE
ncbi:restriction endonuclease subunit S [Mycoplasmopsis arginini]|uniref:restriction endonuclease subunit S n=1 Tax=Mycoplasmopsis arginini TaxID=2094 RepID=UPI00249F4EA3|nr:restriction endonuclease subunit S [Mycoplasmopsis arginini]